LQSKRLYPDEQEWDEDSPLDYMVGFRRIFQVASRQVVFEDHRTIRRG